MMSIERRTSPLEPILQFMNMVLVRSSRYMIRLYVSESKELGCRADSQQPRRRRPREGTAASTRWQGHRPIGF